MRVLLAIALAVVLAGSALAISDQYDPQFQRAAQRYLPEYDWQWLKALCWQESRFDPYAVSPAGARGLCQFMPRTWAEVRAAIGVRNPFDAAQSILGSAWYLQRQARIWTSERTSCERLELAMASYNAGAGNILKAQKECSGALRWVDIRECLPAITGHNAQETIGYVDSIGRWYGDLTCKLD